MQPRSRPVLASALTAVLAGAAAPLAFAPPAQAATAAAPLSPEDHALVDRAAAAIQALKTVQARFSQTSSQGNASSGTLYLQRPGKARFEYDPPAQLLVVSDGYNVKIYDRRLKTFDQYPLGSTPLVLLLAREVRLDRGVAIVAVDHTGDGFTITARDARRQAEGRIILRFTGEGEGAPIALRGWTVVDAQGVETRVRLSALTPVASLDPGLFQLRDPRQRGGPQ